MQDSGSVESPPTGPSAASLQSICAAVPSRGHPALCLFSQGPASSHLRGVCVCVCEHWAGPCLGEGGEFCFSLHTSEINSWV